MQLKCKFHFDITVNVKYNAKKKKVLNRQKRERNIGMLVSVGNWGIVSLTVLCDYIWSRVLSIKIRR